MGLILLILLSLFFAWVFTEHKNRTIESLQSQLNDERILREKDALQHERTSRLLRNTIRELL